MTVIKGFTTKNTDWQDQIVTAVNNDPKAKIKLPFLATNFKCKKNPLKKLKATKIFNFRGLPQVVKKVLFWL